MPTYPPEFACAAHQSGVTSRPRWRETELVLLLGLVAVLYGTRLTDLSIRGEESRRGRIAWEMCETGDWIVPRVQGVPRLTRPPLQYWLIASIGTLRGAVDPLAVRLPSVLATLLTVILIYWYARTWCSALGAFAAGAAYATFGQVLQLGRLGETEAIFTLLLSAALLAWHKGYACRWPAVLTWTTAYFLAALATLAKGPQAPAYFAAGVGVYLLCRRDWRFAWSRAHTLGVLVFLLTVGAWQLPFLGELGPEGMSRIFGSEVAKRFHDRSWGTFLSHLGVFPIEVWACLLPWSLLLPAYCNRKFRTALGTAADPVLFLAVCVAVAFPTVWLPPEARSRYFMPLYPCFAALTGIALQRLVESPPAWRGLGSRRWAFRGLAVGLASLGMAVLAWGTFSAEASVQPLGPALLYAVTAGGLGWLAWRSSGWERTNWQAGVLSVAGLIGLAQVGLVLPVLISQSEDAAGAVARVKATLPPDTRLASFGIVNHLFSFHLGEAISLQEWPQRAEDVDAGVEYFCFDISSARETETLPFEWEQVAMISCDRTRREDPREKVIIGRRVLGPNGAERVAHSRASQSPAGANLQ